jgi:predicted RND superfamily exporter protein
MIPNVFPLLTISGLMGLFNITMESNLIILVSITIGIAVDDTLHFTYHLRKCLKQKLGLEKSIKESLNSTLKALVTTTSVFIFSFPTFLLADLKLFVQVGIFILISLVAALLADFLLLPAALVLLSRKNNDSL